VSPRIAAQADRAHCRGTSLFDHPDICSTIGSVIKTLSSAVGYLLAFLSHASERNRSASSFSSGIEKK
jgi:hypothetical protein